MVANIVLSEVEYTHIGKRPIRPDGVDKVIGRAQYGPDITLKGLLHGKVLRSPYAHARIKSIDTSQAEAYPGVKAVITAQDLPFASLSKEELGAGYQALKFASDHILAGGKVLFKGHPVAVVAAANPHVAEEAAKAAPDRDAAAKGHGGTEAAANDPGRPGRKVREISHRFGEQRTQTRLPGSWQP